MHLNRLKLAIKLKQKKFVAHPNVQQLLASIWYDGLPGFRRKNIVYQGFDIFRIGIFFPIFSLFYIIAPGKGFGQTMRKPFIKFICHSASYFTFLCKYFKLQFKKKTKSYFFHFSSFNVSIPENRNCHWWMVCW